jgi:hypothetical protein
MLAVTAGVLLLVSGSALAAAVRTVASPPVNSSLPTIGGTARDGQTLTAANGSWTGLAPIAYSYEWQRCNAAGSGCKAIAKETRQNYVVDKGDVGKAIRVAVTATNADGRAEALSAATGAVAARGSAPANTQQPNPSGTAREGQTVTVDNGVWTGGQPFAFTYQWQSCRAGGSSCTDLKGMTGASYLIGTSLVGSVLRAVVTASNSTGKASAFSNLTTAVMAKATATFVARFNAVLRSGQEVRTPKRVPTGAAGHFSAKVTGKTLNWTLTFAHLSSRPTASRLNKGLRNASGPAFKTLCLRCLTPRHGTLTLTASQLDAMLRGRAYVNVLTARNPYGEIRGQITRMS